MFLIDKYNIDNLSDIIFHKEIYNKLIIGHNIENLLYDINKLDKIIKSKKKIELATFYNTKNTIYKNYEQMPNLLIHGSDGCGKHTLIKQCELNFTHNVFHNLIKFGSINLNEYSDDNKIDC